MQELVRRVPHSKQSTFSALFGQSTRERTFHYLLITFVVAFALLDFLSFPSPRLTPCKIAATSLNLCYHVCHQ